MTFFLEQYSFTLFSPFVFGWERPKRANAQKLIKFSVVCFFFDSNSFQENLFAVLFDVDFESEDCLPSQQNI